MATTEYAKCIVSINDTPLTEETSVTLSRDTKAQIVDTVHKGFAGLSPGASMITITVKSAVPSADFEMNAISGDLMNLRNLQVVRLKLQIQNASGTPGRTLESKGFIVSDNFSHAVNSASDLDFTFQGEFTDWE